MNQNLFLYYLLATLLMIFIVKVGSLGYLKWSTFIGTIRIYRKKRWLKRKQKECRAKIMKETYDSEERVVQEWFDQMKQRDFKFSLDVEYSVIEKLLKNMYQEKLNWLKQNDSFYDLNITDEEFQPQLTKEKFAIRYNEIDSPIFLCKDEKQGEPNAKSINEYL